MEAFVEILKTILLGIVEGITEWLPISSTGHLILVNQIVQLNVSEQFMDMFNVVIQLGAIMAVVVLYFNKLNPFAPSKTEKQKVHTWQLWFRVVVACLPAAIIGIPLDDWMEEHLHNSIVVAAMLIIYGILFLIVENMNKTRRPTITSFSQMNYKHALIIGGWQVLSLIPGTSRSGATIVGALLMGTFRHIAAEFTFFLAIPVMFGASALKIVKFIIKGVGISGLEVAILIVGCLTAFIVSILAIKFLMGYIKKNDFKVFGVYRIILGIIVLASFFMMK